MAFWMRKSRTGKAEPEPVESAKRRKDEKKVATLKRIDNLRIPQECDIKIKSLGSRNGHQFKTKDLSASGAFVFCEDIRDFPFQQTATILECLVTLRPHEGAEAVFVQFLAKIARVVEPADVVPLDDAPESEHKLLAGRQYPGFGIRIVQISPDQRYILENYIARHGTPDIHGGTDGDERTGVHHVPDAESLDENEQTASSSVSQAG